jgi:UDP-N-acetylmuramate--alanine ligase
MAHYHVIGIAGAGMSAIAHILLDQGHVVSGCDQQANALTRELAARGAMVQLGHDPAHLAGVDTVVISSALASDQPELVAAGAQGIPVLKRADLWHDWSLAKPTLAIAGTHGKTTTTAMCALILSALGYDPAYIVPAGGPVPGLERFARWGDGPFVIEADEYDRLFLGLRPTVAIITSVDWDHVDIYATRQDAEQAFAQFARQTTQTVVACGDDAGVRRLLERGELGGSARTRVVRYGLADHNDWQARDIRSEDGLTHFTLGLSAEADAAPLEARLHAPGRHNVQNALGAALGVHALLQAVGRETSLEQIAAALESFQGAARRFELKGAAGGVIVVDDYGHNPAKVRAALHAARERYPERRLVAYFQPHTFSRTAALIDEFAEAFDEAEVLLIGDIYPARERAEDFPGIDAAFLAQRVERTAPLVSGTVEQSAQMALQLLQPDDLLLTLGAGDGNRVGELALAALREEEARTENKGTKEPGNREPRTKNGQLRADN